jgi:dihydroorotate dehydrogenase
LIHDIATRLLHAFDPEKAHRLSIMGLKYGFGPRQLRQDDQVLATELAGLKLSNPLGLAAGYDKNGDVPDALLAMGFGFVELGAVTPRGQDGKPKPRIFRLPEDEAVINRMGFPNLGLENFARNLRARAQRGGIVGVNLGANLDSEDRVADYVTCLDALKDDAQFFTVNISSPNTPGLRDMQSKQTLVELISRVVEVRGKAPLFLKIAPDIADEEVADIIDVVTTYKMDGLIVSNTTLARPDTLRSELAEEMGGLSGPPVFERSTELVRAFRNAAGPDLNIIGVGGVRDADTAYAKIRAGANAIQLYTALVYEGPSLIGRIKTGLAERLYSDGFASVSEAVGAE